MNDCLQDQPTPNAEQLVRLQDHLMRRFLLQNKRICKQGAPLPPQEVRVLFALAGAGPAPMGTLARELVVSVSSLTAIIDRLVARGLVERLPPGQDRRVVRVALTAEGRRRHEERRQARLGMATAMLDALTPPEQRRFLALMRKIVSQTGVLLLVTLALAATAGCGTVRRARAVQDPATQRPGERTARLDELDLGAGSRLTLEEAVHLAITNSPAVFQARASLAVAENQLQSARAAYLPQASGSAGYGRSKHYSHPAPEAADSHSAGLSLGQDLLSFGRNAASLQQARLERAAAAEQLRASINAVAFQARMAFFDLVRAQDLLVIANEKMREFAGHLDQVRVMAELGTRIRYDITKAEVDFGNARLDALNATNTLLTTRAALGRTLGLAEELPCAIAAPPPLLLPAPEGRDALYQRARRNNPELAALRLQADAASAAVDFAVADLRPDLSFNAGFSWSGSTFPLSRGWSFGPSLDWSLFNGWRKTRALDSAAAQLQATRARIASREQQLFQDLLIALIQLQTARAQADVSEVVVRSARESLDLVSARYRLGLATAVELTDAEVAVAQARTQQVQARRDDLAAQALILLNTGESNWDPEL